MAHLPFDENSDSEWIKDAILQTSTYGILVVGNDSKILYSNEEFIKLLNLPIVISNETKLRDIVGFVKSQVTNPEIFNDISCQYKKSNSKYCFYLKLYNGRVIEVSSSPICDGKIHKGRVYNLSDVTQIQKMELLEEQIKIKQKLLDDNLEYEDMKNRFLNTISHEFKTPLTVILGAVQLILSKHNDESIYCPTFMKARENLDMIRKNCYRAIKLTNNLLDITKIDSGIIDLELKNQDIVSVIENITLSIVEYAKMKNITVIFDTNIEEKVIACDDYLLERVMLNLLSNAIKYTDTNGEIKVTLEDDIDTIRIKVKDTGIGIPEDKLDIIFEKFGLVDTSTRRDHEGIGIGLAIVKSLIEKHGGQVYLNSKVSCGSEFVIELPVTIVDNLENEVISTKNSIQENINIEFSDIYEINI